MTEISGEQIRLGYSEIHARFVDSSHGEALRGSVRFDRFRPEHIDKQTWREVLGSDVDGLEHMPVLYGMTRAFLRANRDLSESEAIDMTEEQESILILAAITNNWGEVETGNLAYDQKTTQIEKEEKDAYRQVLSELLGDTLDIKTRMLVERTVFDKQSNLGQIFDSIQKCGYLRAALLSFNQARSVGDESLAENLDWLCANVLSNQVITLVEYSRHYPPVRSFLEHQHSLISEAFESIDSSIFAEHGQGESMRTELYWQNKRSWNEFNRFKAEDLKSEIVSITLRAIAEKMSEEEAREEIERMIDAYSRALTGNGQTSGGGRSFDKGLFGYTSSYETRYVENHVELDRKLDAMRELGLKIVLTSGSFDLLHVGHAAYLERANQYGDVLVVGVDSDEKVSRKGPDRPMIPLKERTKLLSHLRGVDIITTKQADEEKWGLIKLVKPDTLIITQETYTEKEIVQLYEYCGRVVVLPPQATTSTSAKIRRMNLGFGKKFLEQAKLSVDELITSSGSIPTDELRNNVYGVVEGILDEVSRND